MRRPSNVLMLYIYPINQRTRDGGADVATAFKRFCNESNIRTDRSGFTARKVAACLRKRFHMRERRFGFLSIYIA